MPCSQPFKDIKLSRLGLGNMRLPQLTPGFGGAIDREKAGEIIDYAYQNGINYFDLAAGNGDAFAIFGEALSDVRDRVMYQIHFGADYSKGTYGWTLNLDTIKRSVDKQLNDLKTDYINYGFIHCQDESSDWQKYQKNGVLDYILKMKEQGVVKHIGASSHTPSVIQEIIDTDLIDMLMFSVNPAYDYNHG